ncbi:MAG: hypothetical protein EON58_05035, partial [Alphaproteobacteria bacterium]
MSETVFAGDIEVRVVQGGHEVARVTRPLRSTPHGPVVKFKRRLWPVKNAIIDLDGGSLDDPVDGDAAPPSVPADDMEGNIEMAADIDNALQ